MGVLNSNWPQCNKFLKWMSCDVGGEVYWLLRQRKACEKSCTSASCSAGEGPNDAVNLRHALHGFYYLQNVHGLSL